MRRLAVAVAVLVCIFQGSVFQSYFDISVTSSAYAQEDRRAARERELLRRMQLELQQLNQQVVRLQAENAELSASSKQQEKKIRSLRASVGKKETQEKKLRSQFDTRLKELEGKLGTESARLFEANEQIATLISLKGEQERYITRLEERRTVLNSRIANQLDTIVRQSGMVRACREKNATLYEMAADLVARWRDKGVMDALLQKEPFTQIEWVRMQNTLQEYDDQLRTQQLEMPDIGG